MKHLSLLILLALLAASCGNEPPRYQKGIDTHYRVHDAYFNDYIDLFEQRIGIQSVSTVRFNLDSEKLGDNILGRCIYDFDLVIINKDLWDKYSETSHEILIAHELGHCDLNKDHDHSDSSAIMYPDYSNHITKNYNKDPQAAVLDIYSAPSL